MKVFKIIIHGIYVIALGLNDNDVLQSFPIDSTTDIHICCR